MPNGRSGGFRIETAKLQQLLTSVSPTLVVGQMTVGSRLTSATADQVASCLAGADDRLAVEEQDRAFYIIHIRNEPDILWIMVKSESEIFPALRQLHTDWTAEHPGAKDWIGF